MASMLYLGGDEGVVSLRGENDRSLKVENHALRDWMVDEAAVD